MCNKLPIVFLKEFIIFLDNEVVAAVEETAAHKLSQINFIIRWLLVK